MVGAEELGSKAISLMEGQGDEGQREPTGALHQAPAEDELLRPAEFQRLLLKNHTEGIFITP